MARHSHWAQIKLKKGAADKKRGKIFTRHAHLIETAARQAGGDPNMNASLRLVMENARADNMPRENIDRAIKKGTGELKGDAMEEIMYEGYGPGGVALVIETLTNNKNRSSQMVRTALQKHGGNMGAVGSTSFLFDMKGVLEVAVPAGIDTRDEAELLMIDAGADDIQQVEGGYVIYTAPSLVAEVRKKLTDKKFEVQSAKISPVPKTTIEISDPQTAKTLMGLLEALDDEDDVSNVAANFTLSEERA